MLRAPSDSAEPPSADPSSGAASRRIDTRGRSLRAFAARGVLVNTGFDLGISGISLLRGFILAAILTRTQYGFWGVLVVSLGVLARLKLIGISDKYIQQEEADQELAFQKAFTLELLLSLAAMLTVAAALPLVAIVYGHWSLIAPGLVLITMLLADGLQSPLWVYYRRMDFVRQRLLQSVEPIVGFVVAVALAVAGLGYWALAIGVVAGAWAGAIIALAHCPYRLRWRYDRHALRVYGSFTGPILVATVCSIALANGAMIAVNARFGLAAAGAVALAGNISGFTTRVDDLVATTIYPVICAMQHRLDVLRESFVKSNRLALMWAMPFGIGLALFAGDLVRYGIGSKWAPAVGLLEAYGVVAAINHVAFNWDDYFRARSETWPVAVAALISTVVVLGLGIPLLLTHGLNGLAIGIAAGAAAHLVVRSVYVTRLFGGFHILPHATRAALPTLPAALAVLAIRGLTSGGGEGLAALTLVVYVLVAALATWGLERGLLSEAVGYVLRPREAA